MRTKTIAHFRTGIGNFICMTPALRALAEMDESGKIDIVTDTDWTDSRKDGILDLWKKLPFVQDVFVCNFDNPKFTKEYSVWYYAEWATHGQAFEYFHNKFRYRAPVWDHNTTHETDYYFGIVKSFYGYKGEKPDQLVTPANEPILDLPGKKLVCLCNGSFGDIAIAKKWDGFKGLAESLKNYFGDKIAIAKIGANDELYDVDTFDYDFVNKLSFTETLKVLDQCSLMVTTDTGLMHASDALQKQMIVLWGGSVLEKNKPLTKSARIIHLGYPCQPCLKTESYKTCENYRCMDDISIGEVMFNIREVLYDRINT